MLKTIIKSVEEWNLKTSERAKLQHAYIALAVASVLVAGLVGLVDYQSGQRLVAFALVCGGVFLVNALTWALLSGLVLVRLGARVDSNKPVAPKKSTKKTK